MKNVRLKDLAEKAGVSINTVSRALRDKKDISEKTKKHIREVAKKEGYSHNFAASMIRTNRSYTIGVIVTDISNPVFGEMVRGIEAVARRKGYTILFAEGCSEGEIRRFFTSINQISCCLRARELYFGMIRCLDDVFSN